MWLYLHMLAKFAFYAAVIYTLCIEFIFLFDTQGYVDLLKLSNERNAENIRRKQNGIEPLDSDKSLSGLAYNAYVYLGVSLFGLFTNNWLVFTSLLTLMVLQNLAPRRIRHTVAYQKIIVLLTVLGLAFAVLNAYQLHISWQQMVHVLTT